MPKYTTNTIRVYYHKYARLALDSKDNVHRPTERQSDSSIADSRIDTRSTKRTCKTVLLLLSSSTNSETSVAWRPGSNSSQKRQQTAQSRQRLTVIVYIAMISSPSRRIQARSTLPKQTPIRSSAARRNTNQSHAPSRGDTIGDNANCAES